MRHYSSSYLTLLLCVCACLFGIDEGIGATKDTLFPATVVVQGTELTLQGTGVLRYKRIVPVYDAALYLPRDASSKDALGEIVRRLEVVYRTGAEAKRFADAGDLVLSRSLSAERLESLQSRLARINALYPDPTPGDRCSITFVPGKGTELRFNGETLGWIEGNDFAEAYFSIWLGEDPASKSLRDDLLNKENDP